jgi:hypothetical protein
MNPSLEFEKIEFQNIECFVGKDSGWQLSKEHGFHKISSARDYFVKWVEKEGKWCLYLTSYYNHNELGEIITTVDTLYDVFDYIHKNKKIHY